MSKKTLGLIIVLLLLTITLVVVALRTKQATSPTTNQTATPTATPTPLPPGHTSLMLSPNPVYPTATGTTSATTVDVLIDTGGDEVRSVQLEIAYDPKVLRNVTIKPGTFFTNPSVLPVGGVNQNTGRITFAVVPTSFSESKTGTGVIATLSFTPLLTAANPSTEITLLDKSLVSGQARGQNVLVKTGGTRVMLRTSTQPATGSAR